MTLRGGRDLVKRLLQMSRVKVLYTRITVTRFTIAYFWITLISALVLSALQGVILSDNTQAVSILSGIVHEADVPVHLAVILDDRLQVCDTLPGDSNSNCRTILDLSNIPSLRGPRPRPLSQPDLTCTYSLSWLEDCLHDSQREDVAILFFQFWMFILGIVTILNESLPHLCTALLGHILGGAWAASRIQSTRTLVTMYRKMIVPGLCAGFDPLGSWWELRLTHTIPIAVVNGITVLMLGTLSWKLLKLYSNASFARVGASSSIDKIYKLVLTFSVGLQLSFFFSLASAFMWLDKIAHESLKLQSRHGHLYLAAFIIVLIVEFPFLGLGWISVRKESKALFAIFFIICLILVGISSVMFGSFLYRFIFMTWRFFATVTITSFVFLVLTTVFGLACRLNFGKGLAQYLNVSEVLEGVDFTPVFFPRRSDDRDKSFLDLKEKEDGSFDLHSTPPRAQARVVSKQEGGRVLSVYSDKRGNPVLLSVSPPLVSELGSPTKRIQRLSKKVARAQIRSRYDDWRKSYFASSEESASTDPSTASRNNTQRQRDSDAATTLSLTSRAFLDRIGYVESLKSPSTTDSHVTGSSNASQIASTISMPSKAFLTRISSDPTESVVPDLNGRRLDLHPSPRVHYSPKPQPF